MLKMIWFKAAASVSIIAFVWAGLDFCSRTLSMEPKPPEPKVAVVFTGQYSRITHALHALETGEIEYLFISGVNRGAGMTKESFAEKFKLSGTLRHALETGNLVLGARAQTTLQNTEETRCWLQEHAHKGPVLLITSPDHMPRASLALEATLPGHDVLRAVVPEDRDRMTALGLMNEFAKFLATYVLAYTPGPAAEDAC